MSAKQIHDAIANANAHLSNVGLPTYDDLVNALRDAQKTIGVVQGHLTPEEEPRVERSLKARGLDVAAETRRTVIRRTGFLGYEDATPNLD